MRALAVGDEQRRGAIRHVPARGAAFDEVRDVLRCAKCAISLSARSDAIGPGGVHTIATNASGVLWFDVGNVNGAFCDAETTYRMHLHPSTLAEALHGGLGEVVAVVTCHCDVNTCA
jgi:hypothetical protein